MKNKKLLALISSLVCIAVCFGLLFSACGEKETKKDDKPSETEELTEAEGTENDGTKPEETEAEPTDPTDTEPEATEPTETEPEETEPEETEPEETEPEDDPVETVPSGGVGGNVNTGTGGGYNPGTPEATEPEATEPEPTELVVPEAGSETNAYIEKIPNASGSFKTVKIPAGKAMHYKLQTPGAYLYIESAEVSVVYDGKTYAAENGQLELALPSDGSRYMAMQFVNNGKEETCFAVEIRDTVGTIDNPVEIEDIAAISAGLEQGDEDGIYHKWIADASGELRLSMTEVKPEGAKAQLVVTVNKQSYTLTEGMLTLSVKKGDVLQIQAVAVCDSEGEYPAVTVAAAGYVVQTEQLKVTDIPMEADTVTIPAGKSVYYNITGAKTKILTIADPDATVQYNDAVYRADENGILEITLTDSPAFMEIINGFDQDESYQLSFSHPVGHQKNHHVLTELGELNVQTREGELGYYYSYTVPSAGLLSFQMWTYPETEYAKADIVVMNQTTGASAALWGMDENGEPVEQLTASMLVNAGDVLTIQVYIQNSDNENVSAEFTINGELYGSEELPINIQFPGFEAHVPAGQTMYYEGYNLSGLIFNMEAEGVTVSHNGAEYAPDGGKITFSVVSQGRTPAVFAITNTGTEDAVYEIGFTYPVGHMENPDTLLLGSNTVTQSAGATDYYFTYTAVRAGTLTFTFDSEAQWIYAVDNMTQAIYGDTQFSDSDPMVPETTISVASGDVIRVRVNTYDAANMFETPAGSVTFTVKYVTGPTAITNLSDYTNINLIPGEYGSYSGQFYDHVLFIENGRGLVVNYDGVDYLPNNKGEISVTMPDGDGTGEQPDLSFTVYNSGSSNLASAVTFFSKEVGSKENPEKIGMGSHSFTQTVADGGDYYYVFEASARGNLVFTITTPNTNWYYQVTNLATGVTSEFQMGFNGSKTCRISVRANQSVEIMINTFDPATGKSIEGTVEFTVVLS